MMSKKKPWCTRTGSISDQSVDIVFRNHPMLRLMQVGSLFQILALTFIAGVILTCVVLFMTTTEESGGWMVPIVISGILISIGLIPLFTGTLLCWKAKRVLRHSVIPMRCQCCPECLYDLSARPRDEDTCPECGMIAPRRECVRLWCKLLRSRF